MREQEKENREKRRIEIREKSEKGEERRDERS